MSQQETISTDTFATAPVTASEDSCVLFNKQLADAEDLTNELKRLLVRNETALEQEGLRQRLETLERWMESYRRGLSAARKISENGSTWLTELRQRLKLAADELQRLENEGGNPASKEQTAQAEELLRASRKIDQVIPNITHMFNMGDIAEETKEKESV